MNQVCFYSCPGSVFFLHLSLSSFWAGHRPWPPLPPFSAPLPSECMTGGEHSVCQVTCWTLLFSVSQWDNAESAEKLCRTESPCLSKEFSSEQWSYSEFWSKVLHNTEVHSSTGVFFFYAKKKKKKRFLYKQNRCLINSPSETSENQRAIRSLSWALWHHVREVFVTQEVSSFTLRVSDVAFWVICQLLVEQLQLKWWS